MADITMQADKLRELRELLAKASPGPWSLSGIGRLLSSDRYCIGDGVYGPDADFILAMYQALPELLAIAEGAEADRADARRYRWLRRALYSADVPIGEATVKMKVTGGCPSEAEFDAAIDAALSGAVTQGEGS